MSSALFTETRQVRQIAMDLGASVNGLDTYLTLLRAVLVKLGGSYNRMDTTPILWKRILLLKGGAVDIHEHEWKTIYRLCEKVGAPYDVQFSRAKLIQGLVGKLTGGGPTPPTPPAFDSGIIEEPFVAGTGGNAWASFTGDLSGFTGTSDNDSATLINQDITIAAQQQNNKVTFKVDTLTDGGVVEVDVISASDLSGTGTTKSVATKNNKGNKSTNKLKLSATGSYEVYYDIEPPDGGEGLYVRFVVLGDGISVTVSEVALFPQGDYDLALDRLMHWDWSEATGTADRVDRVNSRVMKPLASITRVISPVGYAIDCSSFSGNQFPLYNNENSGVDADFDFGWDFTRHTVSFLFRRNGNPGSTEVIWACQDSASNSYPGPAMFVQADGTLYYYYDFASGAAGKAIYSTTSVCDNAWHLVTVTWDGNNQFRIFIDGLEDAVAVSIAGAGSNIQYRSCDVFNIGSYYVGASLPFQGDIGDFILYERVLSPGAIAAMANGGSFLTPVAIEATAKAYESIVWLDPGDITWPTDTLGGGQPDDRIPRWQEIYVDQYFWVRDSKGPWACEAYGALYLCIRHDMKPQLSWRKWRFEFDCTQWESGGGATTSEFFISRTNTAATEEANLNGTRGFVFSNPVGGTLNGVTALNWNTPGAKSVDVEMAAAQNTYNYLAVRNGDAGLPQVSFDQFRITNITPLKDEPITGLATLNTADWIGTVVHDWEEYGENGYRQGSASSAMGDAYINENFKGLVESKTWRITFNVENTSSTATNTMGFAQGTSLGHKSGATGLGTVSNVSGPITAVGGNRVTINALASGACSFDVTNPSTVFGFIIFQVDGSSSSSRWQITNFQMTEVV